MSSLLLLALLKFMGRGSRGLTHFSANLKCACNAFLLWFRESVLDFVLKHTRRVEELS